MIRRNPLKKSKAEDFIEKAERKPVKNLPTRPWDDAHPEVIKMFTMRLPLPRKIKLQYITERRPGSTNKFILGEVEKAVTRELKKLDGEG